MNGADQAEWIRRVETEHDNVRAAMATALAGGVDAFIAVKLTVAMLASGCSAATRAKAAAS